MRDFKNLTEEDLAPVTPTVFNKTLFEYDNTWRCFYRKAENEECEICLSYNWILTHVVGCNGIISCSSLSPQIPPAVETEAIKIWICSTLNILKTIDDSVLLWTAMGRIDFSAMDSSAKENQPKNLVSININSETAHSQLDYLNSFLPSEDTTYSRLFLFSEIEKMVMKPAELDLKTEDVFWLIILKSLVASQQPVLVWRESKTKQNTTTTELKEVIPEEEKLLPDVVSEATQLDSLITKKQETVVTETITIKVTRQVGVSASQPISPKDAEAILKADKGATVLNLWASETVQATREVYDNIVHHKTAAPADTIEKILRLAEATRKFNKLKGENS